MAPNGTSEITALSQLIASAVQDIVNEYTKAGHTVPSLHSTEQGPFDAPHLVSETLSKAVQIVEAACAQLTFTVTNPGHTMTNKAYAYEEPACLLVVTNAKIADLLLGKPEGLHVNDLASASGLDSGKLGRILRLLATKHVFDEVKPDIFSNNRLSMQLVSNNPVSSLVGTMTDECFKAGAYLADTLGDPKAGHSTSADDSPFQRVHGVSFFGFYKTPIGKKVNDRFAQTMVGWGEVTGKSMLPIVYDWENVPQDTVICDVGGGNGHATLGLIKKFPKIKVVLQDLPAVIQQGKDHWATECPEAIENQRIRFEELDFFSGQPVSNCDLYYRWSTDEFVIEHAVRDSSAKTEAKDEAPEPLLANYGVSRIRKYNQDLNMMILHNAQERTLQEFITLGVHSGFKFEKLWDSGEAGLIEFIPV
ncbi:3-O-methyltransferase 2 [Psilocybe cubensis]|uniref:O-methyltransferase domain-containing protein n=2 Tax=Psilocybe cubensis TaxID=181762 RepID=A0A8H7XUR7_PSICU|nr:3-O-methyltransferase 2 [Psilocybe cubensis]KAH9479088.1 3-O-methyltransferase 2 [Psilocybe cubensis]